MRINTDQIENNLIENQVFEIENIEIEEEKWKEEARSGAFASASRAEIYVSFLEEQVETVSISKPDKPVDGIISIIQRFFDQFSYQEVHQVETSQVDSQNDGDDKESNSTSIILDENQDTTDQQIVNNIFVNQVCNNYQTSVLLASAEISIKDSENYEQSNSDDDTEASDDETETNNNYYNSSDAQEASDTEEDDNNTDNDDTEIGVESSLESTESTATGEMSYVEEQ